MSKALRVLGYALGGVIGLVAVAAVALYAVTSLKFSKEFVVTPRPFTQLAAADSATLARGEHLATAIGKCGECHGDNLAGKVFIEAPPLGRLVTPNLTRAGLGAELTPQQWSNAIRHGLKRDGKSSLFFMPSEDYAAMTDADLGALVAYIRSLPAVKTSLPTTYVGPVGRALYLAGQFPILAAQNVIDRDVRPAESVAAGPTAEYGKYLANVGGCTGCHGPGLSGGKVPGTPPEFKPAANITRGGHLGTWTEAQFASVLRTGVRPDGSKLDDFMPVRYTKLMTDDEIAALYAYLRSVPAKEFGGR